MVWCCSAQVRTGNGVVVPRIWIFLPVSWAATTAWLMMCDSRSRSGRKLHGTGASRYQAVPMVEVIATFPAICRSGVVGFGSDGSRALVPAADSLMRVLVAVAGGETVCLTGGSGRRPGTTTG